MKKTEHLYELIKSLTAHEKRYFKIFASRHTIGKQNKYVRLFDIIEQGPPLYDKGALNKQLKEAGFIKFISADKKYLYQQLLDSLHAFHLHTNIEARLLEQLHHVKIFFNKGLFDQCIIIVNNLLKECRQKEFFEYELRVIYWKKRLFRLMKKASPKDQLDKLIADEGLAIKKLTAFRSVMNMEQYSLRMQSTQDILHHAVAKKNFSKLLSPWLRKKESSLLSNKERRIWLGLLRDRQLFIGNDLRKQSRISQQIIELIKKESWLIKEEPSVYLSHLNDQTMIFVKTKNYTKALEVIREMRSFPQKYKLKNDYVNLRCLFISYINESDIVLMSANVTRIDKLLAEIKDVMEKYEAAAPVYWKCLLNYNRALLQYANDAPRQALRTINELLINKEAGEYSLIYENILLMKLALHYELGHNDILPGLITKTKQELAERLTPDELPDAFFNFLRDHYRNQKQSENHVRSLKSVNKNEFAGFNYIEWMKAQKR